MFKRSSITQLLDLINNSNIKQAQVELDLLNIINKMTPGTNSIEVTEEGSHREFEGHFNSSKEALIDKLNQALNSEYKAWLLYYHSAITAVGLNRNELAQMYLEHSEDEAKHSLLIGRKIMGLGGVPKLQVVDFPSVLDSKNALDLNHEEEMKAIKLYKEIVDMVGDDAGFKAEIEAIIAEEQHHAEEIELIKGNFEQ